MSDNRPPEIDFARIRPYGQPASRSSAFEEVGSVVVEHGLAGLVNWPEGVLFARFGNPDGGREGRGVLPNGDVWAWQVKYVFEFDASAVSQITSSVRRVLDTEPRLTRYFVMLPLDLPAGDTDERTSAHTRWTEKVKEWKALAIAKAMEVEFVFIGAHQLVTALTEPRHAGRARYWFGADVLTPEWQARRLEETIAKVGRRYTPRLHVDVRPMDALEAVGRTELYVEQWQQILAEVRRARRWDWTPPADAPEAFADPLPKCITALDQVDIALQLLIESARSTDALASIDATLATAQDALGQVEDLLYTHSLKHRRYFVGDAASLYSKVHMASGAVHRARQLARSAPTRAASRKVLLLTGRAGVGKTHLLCDVASRRIAEGRPTILLLGQDFDARSLLSQIGEHTQLGGTLDDVLAALDAASEAAGVIGLFMVDALNDSAQPEHWREDLPALLIAGQRHPNVAVVISCRTEFVNRVIGDLDAPTVEHPGFAEATDAAVRRFTQDYGLEPPTFPVLNPEFGNPLFLKLTCEALATLGETRFPFGSAGLVTVCSAFLEAVNKRLAEPGRCDYDDRSDVVGRVVRELALLGQAVLDRAEVQRITDEALPGRPWSRSLMRGLLAEDVLVEVGDGRITFLYQRLADMTRATVIAESPPEEIRTWLLGLGEGRWRQRGVLGALAVIVPERHGVELLDLQRDEEGRVSYGGIDNFLESLLLRAPDSASVRTVELVHRLLDDDVRSEEIWDRLIRLAVIPNHPLNAEWLHARLAGYELADRDQSWSQWLVGALDADMESAVERLIEWAWPVALDSRSAIPEDVAVLATKTLGWFLTTTDRRVRDRATKALVSVGERAPFAFAQAVVRFHGTNDPYVIERLAAAACGVVLRITEVEATHCIAESVEELVSEHWPLHVITRDFIRRIFGVARASGWSGPDAAPPYHATWPVPTRSISEIEQLAGPPDYAYGSIWYSLAGLGDFGRYILQPALRDVVSSDVRGLCHDAERAVFDRVLELGWTPQRFSDFDNARSVGRDDTIERVGKKYQWIGLYETVGRIADNHAIKPSWSQADPEPYRYAEQLVSRDIDPTVLARKPPVNPSRERRWFSPVEPTFPPGTPDDYPVDMSGMPDPLDLLAVSEPDGTDWLVLVSNTRWEQPLSPEVEALQPPRLVAWMQVTGYLARTGDAAAVSSWAHGKDWYTESTPEPGEAHNVLLGTHADDPGWAVADGIVQWRGKRPPPATLLHCAAWYGGTGTSRDASADDQTRGYVPTRPLVDALGLSRGGDFVWRDAAGAAVQDPSVLSGGPGTLALRRDLAPRLAAAGLTIFWTVLIGYERHTSDLRPPRDEYRWVTASASYLLHGVGIEQVGVTACRWRPGPMTERELQWATRAADGGPG